jgi:hypothetical protein
MPGFFYTGFFILHNFHLVQHCSCNYHCLTDVVHVVDHPCKLAKGLYLVPAMQGLRPQVNIAIRLVKQLKFKEQTVAFFVWPGAELELISRYHALTLNLMVREEVSLRPLITIVAYW